MTSNNRPWNRGWRGGGSYGRGWGRGRGFHRPPGPRAPVESTPTDTYSPQPPPSNRHNSDSSERPLSPPHEEIDAALDREYPAWRFYFKAKQLYIGCPLVSKLRCSMQYFRSEFLIHWHEVECLSVLALDFPVLSQNAIFKTEWPHFISDLSTEPELSFSILGLAAFTVMQSQVDHEPLDKIAPGVPPLQVRVYNYEPLFTFRHLQKENVYGRFISVRGTVIRVEKSRPILLQMVFMCNTCQREQTLSAGEVGRFVSPKRCTATRGCRSRSFRPLLDSSATRSVDFQTIRIQEVVDFDQPIITDDFDEGAAFEGHWSSTHEQSLDGTLSQLSKSAASKVTPFPPQIPTTTTTTTRRMRTLECHLLRDLVGKCVAGDMVTLVGQITADKSTPGASRCVFTSILMVNSMQVGTHMRHPEGGVMPDPEIELDLSRELPMPTHGDQDDCGEFTEKEIHAIKTIYREPDLFKVLVGSLCPAIYGQEIVKAGLLLGLFGGVTRYSEDKDRLSVRGNSHILIVGDPGMGKSQMLRGSSRVAPRSVFVCGATTSSAGLTVSVTRNASSPGFSIDGGALVAADMGFCCIDEFDKMRSHHQSLLEAMEQQSISVAKAGIIATTPARCTILAAANPAFGHYDKRKSLEENLKLSGPLLSRFDLVFVMIDIPNVELDERMSNHALAKFCAHGLSSNRQDQSSESSHSFIQHQASRLANRAQSSRFQDITLPLETRLRSSDDEQLEPIPSTLMKKYIAYARKYVNPRINAEAASVLSEFYLSMKRNYHQKGGITITTRQLESLIRLTEARARAELRLVATEQDALEVTEIVRYSMFRIFDEHISSSQVAALRLPGKSGLPKKLFTILHADIQRNGNNLFTTQKVKALATENGLPLTNMEEIIQALNEKGFLLKRGPGLYTVVL